MKSEQWLLCDILVEIAKEDPPFPGQIVFLYSSFVPSPSIQIYVIVATLSTLICSLKVVGGPELLVRRVEHALCAELPRSYILDEEGR